MESIFQHLALYPPLSTYDNHSKDGISEVKSPKPPTLSPLPGACVPATRGTHAQPCMYVPIFVNFDRINEAVLGVKTLVYETHAWCVSC